MAGVSTSPHYTNENRQLSSLKNPEEIRSVVLHGLALPYTVFAQLGIRASL